MVVAWNWNQLLKNALTEFVGVWFLLTTYIYCKGSSVPYNFRKIFAKLSSTTHLVFGGLLNGTNKVWGVSAEGIAIWASIRPSKVEVRNQYGGKKRNVDHKHY